jgi:PAS domain S-box-containing protein
MCPESDGAHSKLLARVVDEASDFVLVTDFTPPSQGGPYIEYANQALLHATGFAIEELAGKPYAAIIADENDPRAIETINDNLEAARVNEKEILLRRKDGTSFWVEYAGKPLCDEETGLRHWVCVGRDITLRKQSMEQLATLMTAMDAVSGHLEIYALEKGDYTAIFRNREADSDISELVDMLLNDPVLRDATALRERLIAGENVTLTADGLQIRPCDASAATLVCIRQKAS